MKFAIILLALLAGAAQAQTPTFEVASIKKATPLEGPRVNTTGCFAGRPFSDPGMYTCYNATVALMAFQAYSLKTYQLPGVNDDKDRYFVQAKIPPGATADDIRLMLQNLLSERFKLTFHYQPTELTAYELVVAKGGSKMKEAAEPSDKPPASPPPGRTEKDADGFPIFPSAPGSTSMSRANGLERLRGDATSMERFASTLVSVLQQPVFDETGLKGRYDFVVTFTADSIGQAAVGADPVPGLTLFEAIQKELGLRLEKKKRMVDMFVIDHIDKSEAEN